LKFAKKLVTDWLVQYKFRNWTIHSGAGTAVTGDERRARAKEIADQLCDHRFWLTHGRSIKMDDLKRMRLLVTDYSQSGELADAIGRYYALLQMSFATNLYKIYETVDSQILKFVVPQVPPPKQILAQQIQAANMIPFELHCDNCKSASKLQANFGTPQPILPGHVPFPKDNKFRCPHCGTEHDLIDARPQLEAQAKKPVV